MADEKISALPDGDPPDDADEFVVARGATNVRLEWAALKAGIPGGSQNLAQVLAVGGDPEGNPITGAVTITPSDSSITQFKVLAAADPDDNYPYVIDAQDNSETYGLLLDNHGGGYITTDPSDGSEFALFVGNNVAIKVAADSAAAGVGFFGTQPIAQPAAPVTLGDLADALAALGLTA